MAIPKTDRPMDNASSLLGMALIQEVSLTELRTLAIEYEEKTISAERFAKRSVEILCELQKTINQLKADPPSPSQKP